MTEKRPSLKKTALWLCFAYLVAFLVLYMPIYVFEAGEALLNALTYVNYGLFDVVLTFSVPVISAVILFLASSYIGKFRAALFAIPLALPSLVYNLPYYYLVATENHNDWQESLLYSLLICLIELIKISLNTAAIYLAARLTALLGIKKRLVSELPPKKRDKIDARDTERIRAAAECELAESLGSVGIFDFSIPFVKGIFFGAFLQFSIFAIYEIVSVISHLVEYGDFRTGELVFAIGKFVSIFILLFATHAISYFAARKIYGKVDDNADH